MKRIAFVVATPVTANAFLKGHFSALSKYYEVDLIANFQGAPEPSLCVNKLEQVPISRDINIWKDLWALLVLIRLFASRRYDAVHTVTPKAGFLGMMAAWLVRIPVRHHTFTGQVWATKHGFSRWFLRMLDKALYRLSTDVLVDSNSQRQFLIAENVLPQGGGKVLAYGSICGVDLKKYTPNPLKGSEVRQRYSIRDDELVFLFLGRINPEKGVPELVSAFRSLAGKYQHIRLLVVGPDESSMFADGEVQASFLGKLIKVGFTNEPEAYFNAADILCLPSHREGFGSVIIEAAACGTPSVASNIYGLSDAVVDGQTGILHQPKSVESLTAAMELMIVDTTLRAKYGVAAEKRAREKFSSSTVEQALVAFYRENSRV